MKHERSQSRSVLAAMPKVELHRHLEGSIRLATLVEVGRKHCIPLPLDDPEHLRPLVQMTGDEPWTVERFLSKFAVLRRFFVSPEVIQRITAEAIADAAAENVRYLELRFTPAALANQLGCSFGEVTAWVAEAARREAREQRIKVRLVVSINRHESINLGEQALRAALDFQMQGVVGLDLAGNEKIFPARPFAGLFREAQQSGLGLTVHAGEWASAQSVREAITELNVDRIGHGVRVVEDSSVARLAQECGVVFEVCPTSNLQTGSVSQLRHHPLLDLHYLGLPLTINTDDPAISNISLTDEYEVVVNGLGFSSSDLHRYVLQAARSAFLPVPDRDRLVTALRRELKHWNSGDYPSSMASQMAGA